MNSQIVGQLGSSSRLESVAIEEVVQAVSDIRGEETVHGMSGYTGHAIRGKSFGECLGIVSSHTRLGFCSALGVVDTAWLAGFRGGPTRRRSWISQY